MRGGDTKVYTYIAHTVTARSVLRDINKKIINRATNANDVGMILLVGINAEGTSGNWL